MSSTQTREQATVPTRPAGSDQGTVRVRHDGVVRPAAEVAGGAAYELFAEAPEPGFLANPRPGAGWRYRRFVHATEAVLVDLAPGRAGSADPATGPADPLEPLDPPLAAPVSRALSRDALQRMSQTPPGRCDPGMAQLIRSVRRTATVRRGTQMIKFLSGRQVAGYLGGWPLTGFCHREYDVAHLRTPAELSPLTCAGDAVDDVVFGLRWRALDPDDYAVPFDATLAPDGPAEVDVTGLSCMPPQARTGPPVLGTGFAPSRHLLVPEWVISDFVSLPLPVGASIVAFTPDGSEIMLYGYQPEQHAWLRMCGPQWRGVLAAIPTRGPAGQEYFPVTERPTRLVGLHQGRLVEAIADPPADFRVAAKTRSARYPVEALARRARYAVWRGALCTVARAQGDWRLLRLCRPDPDSVERLSATSVERGVYETWAPAGELTDERDVDLWYSLPRPS